MEEKMKKVLENYDFQVNNFYRTRGAFLLETNSGPKLMREYTKLPHHFQFANEVKKKVNSSDCIHTDIPYRNILGEGVTTIETGEVFVVYNWFRGEECNVLDSDCLQKASQNLGQLHTELRDFKPIHNDGRTEDILFLMGKRMRELKRIYMYMKSKKRKNEFEIIAMDCFPAFYQDGIRAMEQLAKLPYYLNRENRRQNICHGDYNYHNVLMCRNSIATIGFEKCCFGEQLMDLYYFFRKAMEKNHWQKDKAECILAGYQEVICLSEEERSYLYILLLFPEKYWKLMNQYYNRKKSWLSHKNMQKLEEICRQHKDKSLLFSGKI